MQEGKHCNNQYVKGLQWEIKKLKAKTTFISNRVKPSLDKQKQTIASLKEQLKDKSGQIGRMKKQGEDQEKLVDELIRMAKELKNNKEEREMIQQRNRLIKQNQFLSEELQRYKQIDAQSKVQITQLVNDLQHIIQISNQQIAKANQHDTLQQAITDKDRTIDSLRVEVKALTRKKDLQALKQEEALRKQVESLYAESQSRKKTLTALESELKNAKLNSKKENAAYLLQFINTEAKSVFQFDKTIETKQEFLMYCSFLQKQLISSDILNSQQKAKSFVINAITSSSKTAITKTRLLFKYDQFHKGFGSYLNSYTGPLLLLIKLKNGRICGGFCPQLGSDSESDSTILFTYLDIGRVFSKLQGARKGCMYANNSLIFGSNQLVLMNNQAKHFRVSTNQFGARYFKMKQLQFVDDDSSNVIPFEEMELHVVDF